VPAAKLGSVDVSFTAAFGPVLGLNKEKIATCYEYHERFLTFVPPQKGAKPEGLCRKMAIHCVMLLDNNPLLPSSHALCLAVFRLSAMANETSTDPRDNAIKLTELLKRQKLSPFRTASPFTY
jgi:hypothetical protein